MNDQTVFRLNRQALIAAIISAAFPVMGHAAAGRVEFSVGNVTASGADGAERSLAKGGDINNGDTIKTSDGRVQIKFTDGGYMSLQPNTQFKVDDYAYDGKADGSEKGFFKLVKGGLRAITGAIGHTNKTTYRINTPVATIGIRGTELTGEYTEEGDNKKLIVHVSEGSVFLENGGGDLILFQGQSGVVTDENQEPDYTDEETLITAQGPGDSSAEENNEQQQQQQEQSLIFTDAEQVNGDGIPDAILPPTNNADTLAAIASYTAANAEGIYYLDYSGTMTAIANTSNITNGSDITNVKLDSGTLFVEFGPRIITAEIEVSATQTFSGSGSSTIFQSFYGVTSGALTGGAGLNFSADGDSSLCSCTFNAVGLFKGPTAQQAGINYTISGLSGSGTAGFYAPIKPVPGGIYGGL